MIYCVINNNAFKLFFKRAHLWLVIDYFIYKPCICLISVPCTINLKAYVVTLLLNSLKVKIS